MKVLLVNPPYTRIRGSGQSAYFPLGLGYLAGTLAREGFEPVIYSAENCQPGEPLPKISMREVFELRSKGHRSFVKALQDDDHFVWKEVEYVLETVQPHIVGITALSVQFGSAAKIARIVKSWRPDCPVVFGGHHVTYMPLDSLRRVPHFDVGVLGEGEETFLELCRAYAAGRRSNFNKIPGLIYRSGNGIMFSEHRKLIENLDALPNPRKDLLIFPESYHPSHFSTIIYGRGCPWRCRFCSSQEFWRRRIRIRSAENCLNEIKDLMQEFHINNFMFWDDAFSVRRRDILEFCGKAVESGLRFTFSTATRADLVDEELLFALKRAGCVVLTLGVESGSPRVLEMIRKDLDLDVLRNALGLMRKKGISQGVFFMAGFPHETAEDLHMTFDLIRELKVHRVTFNIFDPMPGSELYDEAIELGLVSPDADWCDFRLWPDAHFTTRMTDEQFDALACEIAGYVFQRNDAFMNKLRRHLPLLKRTPSTFCSKAVRKILGYH